METGREAGAGEAQGINKRTNKRIKQRHGAGAEAASIREKAHGSFVR